MTSSTVPKQDEPIILIVEDNRVNQLLLLKRFAQQGFRSMLLAKNGQEALAMALANDPDLILMDIQLPDMNGNEVIQKLRNEKFSGSIVAVSADSLQKDMDASRAAGADGYITKPIDYDTFFATINGFLRLPDGREKTPPGRDAADSQPYRIDAAISAAAKNVFIMDAREKLQLLADALEHVDDEEQMKRIKAIAHEYKGNAGYFGLKELEGIARELDMGLANDQPQDYLLKLTRQLVAAIKRIINGSN